MKDIMLETVEQILVTASFAMTGYLAIRVAQKFFGPIEIKIKD